MNSTAAWSKITRTGSESRPYEWGDPYRVAVERGQAQAQVAVRPVARHVEAAIRRVHLRDDAGRFRAPG